MGITTTPKTAVGSEMTSSEKAISLYQYIRGLTALKQRIISNISDYPWAYAIADLPTGTQHIEIYYRDRVETEEAPADGNILLRVHKPEFQKCPLPDEELYEWLKEGWDSFRNEVTLRETIERTPKKKPFIFQTSLFPDDSESSASPEAIIERFDENEERVEAYNNWKQLRDDWVQAQIIIDHTRQLFTKLYQVHIDLERESETLELVAANGFIRDRDNAVINHPIITRRVRTHFDAISNTVSIEDVEVETELNTTLFQSMANINLDSLITLRNDLQTNDYHPFDRNDTPEFLKVLIHQLSPESMYSETKDPEGWQKNNRLLIYFSPYFILRKRVDGSLKAVEQIIDNIEKTNWIPQYLDDIVSGGQIEVQEDVHEETVEEQLAAVGGESIDILLSKEANKEQLEIAKRIEQYNAVLVQGPPGTGKTHTIANLMGHFLAQGKSVLITSHTKKALSVLKEKVAIGLQNLCVSVLDDSNEDMERSVDGITDYMSKYTSYELKKQMDSIALERKQIIDELADTRKKLFAIINRECNCIVFNGEEISPSKAAAYVMEHREDMAYIPGTVRLYEPLPLTFSELSDLYKSNTEIDKNEEGELAYNLPDPDSLLSPSVFTDITAKRNQAKQHLQAITDRNGMQILRNAVNHEITVQTKSGSFTVKDVSADSISLIDDIARQLGSVEPWKIYAAIAVKKGGAYIKRWTRLIEQITKTCKISEITVEEQFGRKIEYRPNTNFEELVPILEKLKEHLESKGKVSKLDLLFNRSFGTALEAVTIDNVSIKTAEECTVVLHDIQLNKERSICSAYWHELLAVHDVEEFYDLDLITPEYIAKKWIGQIIRYLKWYSEEYPRLIQALNNLGIQPEILFPHSELDSDFVVTERIFNAVHDQLPVIADIYRTVSSLKECDRKIQNTLTVLNQKHLAASSICDQLIQAVNNEDISAYEAWYENLKLVFAKYDIRRKREELLEKLMSVAPQWADAIRNREGIHGESMVPPTVEGAWKWKQYSGIISEITSVPFKELQNRSLVLSKKYREATARYAEKCAWYHLMQRTEHDIDMKQALQGWKQTVKKIGKGTGKNAPMYRAEARRLMAKCQTAVPAWIMPISKALESLNPHENRFDVIIVDEASQSDVSALAVVYMAKKLIIVGDDKQVSPMAVGVDTDRLNALVQMHIKDIIPNSHLYDAKTSLYDIAATTFQPLMLREHFRCVPEIIGFSNGLSYDYKIKPLRESSSSHLLPAVVNYRVENGRRDHRKTNLVEAQTIVSLLKACMAQPEYDNKTFGVISMLGDEQAKLIQNLIFEHIDVRDIESRRILCGNASHFQGDERDVVFLSIVDSNEGTGPISLQGFGVDDAFRKRYNVAASRARDQLWVVDSLDSANDLKPGDIRKRLIDYSLNPAASEALTAEIEQKSESPFEEAVAKALVSRGYHVVQQWKVGAYRLDMVVLCGNKSIALECDGERWHSGEAKIREDMERQTILERIGWRFIRIRGSEYYGDPEATLERIIDELCKHGIEPEEIAGETTESTRSSELLQRTKLCASQIFSEIFEESVAEEVPMPISSVTVEQVQDMIVPQPEKTITKEENSIPELIVLPAILPAPATAPKDPVDIIAMIEAEGIEYVDKRSSGGALWIIGDVKHLKKFTEKCKNMGIQFTFKPSGGRATNNRDAWWTK